MTYRPVLPISGYAGWMFLKRTQSEQIKAYSGQAVVRKDAEYFREKIASIRTAEDLVSDYRLLRVSLSAFGLEADLPNKFFIRRILEEGTLDPKALPNRLADKRYVEFSKAFGFGNFSTPNTQLSDFPAKILNRFLNKSFQAAVGEQNQTFRLALNAESQLLEISKSSASARSKWFTVLGTPPLREVFEKAFGLPSSFAGIDLDKQVQEMEFRTQKTFGTSDIGQFANAETMDKLVRLFVIRSEVASYSFSSSGGQVALTLLQQSNFQRT